VRRRVRRANEHKQQFKAIRTEQEKCDMALNMTFAMGIGLIGTVKHRQSEMDVG